MHFYGSRQLRGSGAGAVLTSPKGDKFCYVLQLQFTCTSNAAEYEAMLHGLRLAREMIISRIQCYGDSNLVSQQVSGKWNSKDATMAAYRRGVKIQAGFFVGYQVDYVERKQNEAAEALSRLGSERKPVPPNVFLDVLTKPSVQTPTEQDIAEPDPEPALIAAIHATPSWVVPYLDYKNRGILPSDEILDQQIVRKSKSFVLINGELHRQSPADVFQRCVSPEEGRAILNKIHSGDYGHHAGSRSLVAKA